MENLVEDKNSLLVRDITPGDKQIGGGLGITEERQKELLELCKNSFNDSKNFVECMEKVSKECKHANELCFTSMVVTKIHSRVDSPLEGLRKFADLLGKITRSPNEEED